MENHNNGKTPYDLARDNYGNNHSVIKLLHNFKWIESDKTKINRLKEKINILKRKCENYETISFKKPKTINNKL